MRTLLHRLGSAANRFGGSLVPSTLMLAVIAAFALALVFGSVIAGYFGLDVIGSLSYVSVDGHCYDGDRSTGLGVHCFGDYYQVVEYAQSSDPWSGQRSNYPASGMIPYLVFGAIGSAVGAPQVGLLLFMLTLGAAIAVPAIWATHGKPAWIRIVVVGLVGVASVPALMALDRGNGSPFAVPALLAFLVALRKGDERLTVITIVIAALVRPQYAILIAALMAGRRWRATLTAFVAIIMSNLLAYLLWPAALPGSIAESIGNALQFGTTHTIDAIYPPNVSISKAIYLFERIGYTIAGEAVPEAVYSATNYIGTLVAVVIAIAVIVLGRRIPAHIGGIVILMTASLFSGITFSYYLVFCLPIAAILLRDPIARLADSPHGWNGVLDDERGSRTKRAAAILIALATAVSLSRVVLGGTFPSNVRENESLVMSTSAGLAPVFWLAAAIVTLIAWRAAAPKEEAA